MTRLATDVRASTAGVTGQGVQIVIIGGGLDQNDDFRCGTTFQFHDTFIRDIIKELAPDTSFRAYKVCNAQGTCSSADTVRALMNTVYGLAGQE